MLSRTGELQIGPGPSDEARRRYPVAAGDLVRIPPGAWHRIFCRGQEPLTYLSVDCFREGRPAAEPTWESHVRAMRQANGWDFEAVRGRPC